MMDPIAIGTSAPTKEPLTTSSRLMSTSIETTPDTTPTNTKFERDAFVASGEEVEEYFRDYDLRPVRIQKYPHAFSNGIQVCSLVTHYRHLVEAKLVISYVPPLLGRAGLLAMKEDFEEWSREVSAKGRALACFDTTKAMEVSLGPNHKIIYLPKHLWKR